MSLMADRQPQAGLTHKRHGPQMVILEGGPLWRLCLCSLRLRFLVELLCKILALLFRYLGAVRRRAQCFMQTYNNVYLCSSVLAKGQHSREVLTQTGEKQTHWSCATQRIRVCAQTAAIKQTCARDGNGPSTFAQQSPRA